MILARQQGWINLWAALPTRNSGLTPNTPEQTTIQLGIYRNDRGCSVTVYRATVPNSGLYSPKALMISVNDHEGRSAPLSVIVDFEAKIAWELDSCTDTAFGNGEAQFHSESSEERVDYFASCGGRGKNYSLKLHASIEPEGRTLTRLSLLEKISPQFRGWSIPGTQREVYRFDCQDLELQL